MVDDQVLTLTDRINGCMRRSLNGKDLPSEGREMEAIIAYLKFAGHGSPEGVRVAGMGLRPIANPASPPDARRGEEVYAKLCATCHKEDGQGEPKPSPGVGYSIPPLWGEASFNAGAGMAKTAYAASYIRDNMPMGVELPGAAAHRSASLGRLGLHHLQAASAGDGGNDLHAGLVQARAKRTISSVNSRGRSSGRKCPPFSTVTISTPGMSARSCSRSSFLAQSWSPHTSRTGISMRR